MDGIIVVNKEKDYTSRDIVNIVGKAYNTKKVGHTGTLDPIAEGVLIVCMNKALKVAEFITSDDKEYIAEVILGIETDTLDITGKIVNTNDKKVSQEEIEAVLTKFKGKINQQVPLYSAVKVNGKKLYEYARNNIEVELPTKVVNIYNIELLGGLTYTHERQSFTIKCKVSKGTYIRSLIRDIGTALGTVATMKSLIRTKQAGIDISKASSIEEVKNKQNKIYRIDEIIDLPKVIAPKELLKQIKNGSRIPCFFNEKRAFIVDNNNNIIAIYEQNCNEKNEAKLIKMINNE